MCVIHLCSVFLDVYDVLCPAYLNTCVRVCQSFHGQLRECLRARCFRATLLLHLHLCAFAIVVWIQKQKQTKKSPTSGFDRVNEEADVRANASTVDGHANVSDGAVMTHVNDDDAAPYC